MSSEKINLAKWVWERAEKYGIAAVLLGILLIDHAYNEYVYAPSKEIDMQKYVAEQLQLQRTHFDKVLEEIKEAYRQ